MYLEIITPEEKIFEGEVIKASFKGVQGSFQILNGHAAFVTSLGTGDLKFSRESENKTEDTILGVDGGVVEVLNNRVMVLLQRLQK